MGMEGRQNLNVEELFRLYGNDVLRMCNVYLRKQSLAEDAFQDVFVKVMTRSDSYRGDSDVKYWILSIARNVCLDYLKSSYMKRTSFMGDLLDKTKPQGEEKKRIRPLPGNQVEDRLVEAMDTSNPLLDAVQNLPAKYKDVILLRFYFDMDNEAIARQLGITESTVRSRLMRARAKLKDFGREE
ncbi:MAG TPA: RNA polymerase subunit sigma [Clostridiales bacterium]|jgi:RNA polymerase sigma-70 factor (ECF subfamily)|nr:sigma-70 family RNA polymerase sigma factor [Saccharofermentanaceae bacterium]HBY32898.1 RNA polymerase subunit sigma [Clostridiales bacterium]HBZ77523.1 RNA polymerase subunit sigma [Clostridiales bacterium]